MPTRATSTSSCRSPTRRGPPRCRSRRSSASSTARASTRTATSAARSSCPGRRSASARVRQKLNAMGTEFKGKNILIVDDSIVRGTTSKEIVEMARAAGANKVTFTSAAPPVRYPHVYGINMPSRQELVAHGRKIPEIARELGADHMIYQEVADLQAAITEGTSIEQLDMSASRATTSPARSPRSTSSGWRRPSSAERERRSAAPPGDASRSPTRRRGASTRARRAPTSRGERRPVDEQGDDGAERGADVPHSSSRKPNTWPLSNRARARAKPAARERERQDQRDDRARRRRRA